MERTKNDKQIPAELDGQSAKGAGLSSAMHDIRMLASRYESERQGPSAGDSLRLAGVTTMQPQHILQPRENKSADKWKGPALVMLMLLGLSTSVLALSIYAEPDTLVEPVFFETESLGHVERPALVSPPTIQLPNEEPRLEASREDATGETALRSPAAPESRQRRVVTPKITRRASAEESASEESEEWPTCDEVACLIDSQDPCCSQYASVTRQVSEVEDHSPHRPTRADVMKAMRGIEGEVLQCFDTHGESGLASVDFVIETDGTVREVELSQGALAFRACVREHVRTLEFERLKAPFKMSFPFRK